ncbi:MAG TPA: hypothetical protein GXX53_07205 [Tissierellia bacterium]|nr:hypothetical protein [Tissierellia bacterium]
MKGFKRLILLGIILVLLTPVFGLTKNDDEMDLMLGILRDTGASFVESDIALGGVILDRFIDEEELLKLGNHIKDEMNIMGTLTDYDLNQCLQLGHKHYSQKLTKDEGLNQLVIQGMDSLGNIVTISISSYEVEGYPGETSLFINLINNNHFVKNNDIILKVDNIFQRYDKMMNVTKCIVGTIDGRIDIDESEDKVLKSARKFRGRVVESYKEEGVLSLSMFTPYIDEYIYTGTRKMNLNIAVNYNECEDKTYVWIGTPIITIGY